jgi:hypothetical protein
VSARAALILSLLCGCSPRDTLVGSLTCSLSSDCAPPTTVCSADGRCVDGCLGDPDSCAGGASCDPGTGECVGGMAGNMSCTGDTECDPPDLVCRVSTQTCVAGCTVGDNCADGFRCDPKTGHCCSVGDPACPDGPDAGSGCNSDSECVGAPANICSGGACVPGCLSAGCTLPQSCDPNSGHCTLPRCVRDADCDDGSYCTQSSRCDVLAFGGKIDCAGGTNVAYKCAIKTSASDFTSCAGAPGPVGCPYCIDRSCFHPGLCARDGDCHGGDSCVAGLCRVDEPACPTVVALDDVVKGRFAAGKEVCVRGPVTEVRSGYDGMNEIKLGSTPFLFVDVSPLYQSAGVILPQVGMTITVHGTVRWDDAHADFELLPVDFIGP